MSGNNYPKKMQVHLTEAQHQAFKDYAYRSKVSMMECVRGWIGEKCCVDLKVGKVVLAPYSSPELEPNKKAERVKFSKSSFAKPDDKNAQLKEGYGWCKGCGVEQVKLPGMLCKKCGEP